MAAKKKVVKTTPKPAKRRTAKKTVTKAARPELQKVAFTLFYVDDPMRARGFYEDVLGLTRGLASPDGGWTEYDLPGGGCLALFKHPDPKQQRPAGGASIAFEVSDLDVLNRRLKKAGVKYHGDVVRGPHCRMSNISDTEGNAIILHQLNRLAPGS